MRFFTRFQLLLLALCLVQVGISHAEPSGCVGGAAEPQIAADPTLLSTELLDNAFKQASEEFGVPVEILKAVATIESNMVQTGPTCDYGYGIMHLVDNDYCQTLQEASELVKVHTEVLKRDAVSNIRAGAALIAKYAKETVGSPKTSRDYFQALKKFSGLIDDQLRESQACEYYRVMGVDVSDLKQDRVTIRSDDYGPAVWNPADPSNYGTSRYGTAIDRWVNHWVGTGTFAGCISWFKNPAANTSAHFVIRSSDGYLVQMVRFAHRAWHCGNWNSRSIGIEHESTAVNPGLWNSTPMLTVSTTACRFVCEKYGFPKTRTYIVGHKEVPGSATACPGPLPWTTYMTLVGTDPTPPGDIIESRAGGKNFSYYSESGVWADSSTGCIAPGCTDGIGQRYGSTYRSVAGAKSAFFRPNLAQTGLYNVYVAWGAANLRQNPVTYEVSHTGGVTKRLLDQTVNANTWVLLGQYSFVKGTEGFVEVSNKDIDVSGNMYAGAARFELVQAQPDPTATPTPQPTNTPVPTPTLGPPVAGNWMLSR